MNFSSASRQTADDDDPEILKAKVSEGLERIFASGLDAVPIRGDASSIDDVRPEVKLAVMSLLGKVRDFGGAQRLCQYLNDPDASYNRISDIIMKDPVLSGKILRTANSAYFGSRNINSIPQALTLLGQNAIKGIVFMRSLSNLVRKKGSLTDMIVEMLWQHSVLTSICSSCIAGAFRDVDRDALFTLGLLHDIGKFINADRFPTLEDVGDCTMPYAGEFTLQDESRLFGINHSLIGKLAFESWGLSSLMVETVRMHHDPDWQEKDETGLTEEHSAYLAALYLSNQISKLFIAENMQSIFKIQPLPASYHGLVDRRLLEKKVLSKSLFQEVEKAKILAEF
jgi:HD-like signal output (HDOD) protein